MTFRDTLENVMRATRLNTEYFAETVTFRGADGCELVMACHVRHTIRHDARPDGTTTVVEQIRVEIDRAQLECPPDYNDRILLQDDDYAYLYAYAGKHTPVSWKGVFERKRKTAQGASKAKAA
jgi:hypothetical protein